MSKRIVRAAGLLTAAITVGAITLAPPAFATTAAASCSGHSSGGVCLFENSGYTPPFAWFAQNHNIPQFSAYYYYNTTTSMHANNGSGNGVTAVHNFSTSCTMYIYKDSFYGGASVKFLPTYEISSMSGTAVGNDEADSIYWYC
jgi:hypothetical protein